MFHAKREASAKGINHGIAVAFLDFVYFCWTPLTMTFCHLSAIKAICHLSFFTVGVGVRTNRNIPTATLTFFQTIDLS